MLTHKAGMAYLGGVAADLYADNGVGHFYIYDRDETIGEYARRFATTVPLTGQPGEAVLYGISLDIMGYFVEVISGMPYDQFLQERIFGPLGMDDTSFFLPVEKLDRFGAAYNLENKCISTFHLVQWKVILYPHPSSKIFS